MPRLILAVILACVADAALAQAPVPAPGWGVTQLMTGMQGVRHASARFVERRFMQMLRQPLQSSGRLIYSAPDRLQKETLAPTPSELIVNGDRLTVQQPDGKMRDLSVSEFPEIGALVASVRATLAGDAATLTRYYTLTLTGSVDGWLLQLEPRDQRLRGVLTMIRIQGEGDSIRGIETIERNGDRTEMAITPDPE
jgi:outer membrane lipoprotein-sorting protein